MHSIFGLNPHSSYCSFYHYLDIRELVRFDTSQRILTRRRRCLVCDSFGHLLWFLLPFFSLSHVLGNNPSFRRQSSSKGLYIEAFRCMHIELRLFQWQQVYPAERRHNCWVGVPQRLTNSVCGWKLPSTKNYLCIAPSSTSAWIQPPQQLLLSTTNTTWTSSSDVSTRAIEYSEEEVEGVWYATRLATL